ncbi:hypothetical protein [Actinomadura sp. DC4]|uniref:hypothetical protein n=1 Tax=Actinomadura sp. DC4 TaxID=3055069 RepID=UPI0025B133BA|nr:hypothetical protein [Actinomadura sp. DC4]MDN3352309.1 hypothetical protein [Actinomadura sp. DC4]
MTTPSGETNATGISELSPRDRAKRQKTLAAEEISKTEETRTSVQAQLVLALSNLIRSIVDPADPSAVPKLAAITETSPSIVSGILLGRHPAKTEDFISQLSTVAVVSREDGERLKDLLGNLAHVRQMQNEAHDAYRSANLRLRDMEARQRGAAAAEAFAPLRTVGQPQTPCAIPDAAGYVYKPDPLEVETEENFVQALRELVVWAGNPGLREISRRCGGSPTHSSFSKMLSVSTVPPKFEPVRAFITALGLEEKDVGQWMTAWRRFVMPMPRSISPWAADPWAETG